MISGLVKGRKRFKKDQEGSSRFKKVQEVSRMFILVYEVKGRIMMVQKVSRFLMLHKIQQIDYVVFFLAGITSRIKKIQDWSIGLQKFKEFIIYH